MNAVLADISEKAPQSDVVVAVGGGSVLDAAKAVAAGVAIMRAGPRAGPSGAPGAANASESASFDITRYLEGVGDLTPDGSTLPVIAFPTTAGTGSEATMNAVLSRLGPDGFKKSLRHPGYVPRLAVLDPDLFAGCPLDITRASGLDAITQLLEAYTSTKTNAMVDSLAELGLSRAGSAFPRLLAGEDTPDLRANMALAAYLSGVCLAAAGLGVVHGFAAPLGALRDIPHGAVCGMLLGPVMRATLRVEAVPKYDRAAALLGLGDSADAVIERVESWAEPLGRLSDYGFVREDLPTIVTGTGLKNHPVKLSDKELTVILEEVL
ncbi:MAG: iron-containing alcohol dehydrogenase [Spirochaetaceae bacterium]|nr:MAG: iron-containing alcohol dehydrogenase [Spirochaetaceae bacterium]